MSNLNALIKHIGCCVAVALQLRARSGTNPLVHSKMTMNHTGSWHMQTFDALSLRQIVATGRHQLLILQHSEVLETYKASRRFSDPSRHLCSNQQKNLLLASILSTHAAKTGCCEAPEEGRRMPEGDPRSASGTCQWLLRFPLQFAGLQSRLVSNQEVRGLPSCLIV